jgi:hypothetical protein
VADLLTHLATVYVPTRLGVKDPAARSLVYLGVCLPDVVSHAGNWAGVHGSISFHEVVHTPAFVALAALTLSQLFAVGFRRMAFVALLFGGLAHLLLDAGKDYLGTAGLMWGLPWGLGRWEWGFFRPEHTVYFMPPALLAIVLARTVGRLRDDRMAGCPPKSRPLLP